MTDINYITPTEAILVFIKNLGLSDHMGDVADDVARLLAWMDIDVGTWNDFDELTDILAAKGIKYWFEYGEVKVYDPASDLLEACERLIQAYDNDEITLVQFMGRLGDYIASLRAAIAKAKGE